MGSSWYDCATAHGVLLGIVTSGFANNILCGMQVRLDDDSDDDSDGEAADLLAASGGVSMKGNPLDTKVVEAEVEVPLSHHQELASAWAAFRGWIIFWRPMIVGGELAWSLCNQYCIHVDSTGTWFLLWCMHECWWYMPFSKQG